MCKEVNNKISRELGSYLRRVQEKLETKDEGYTLENENELLKEEAENLDIPEEAKHLIRFLIDHNEEEKVIKICPGNGNYIALHGASDVEDFIKAIRDYSNEVFED